MRDGAGYAFEATSAVKVWTRSLRTHRALCFSSLSRMPWTNMHSNSISRAQVAVSMLLTSRKALECVALLSRLSSGCEELVDARWHDQAPCWVSPCVVEASDGNALSRSVGFSKGFGSAISIGKRTFPVHKWWTEDSVHLSQRRQ